MTQLLNHFNLFEVHKKLPKKQSHLKEKYKLEFIKVAFKEHIQGNHKKINFDESRLLEKKWQLVYEDTTISLEIFVSEILDKWYFSNLPKNENIYFYRFVNVIRELIGEKKWESCCKTLVEHDNLILRENINAYLGYRYKLDEIEKFIGVSQ